MRRRNARNSLLGSVLLMLLSCAMLLGTTFAWFSDTTTSGAATIQAGNLKVGLEYAKQPGPNETNQTLKWETLSGTTQANLFSGNQLFEPGYTGIVYFRVKNEGSLALKYKYQIVVSDNVLGSHQEEGAEPTPIDLTDYIQMRVVDPAGDAPFTNVSEEEFWTTDARYLKETGIEADGNGGREGVAYDSSKAKNVQPEIVEKNGEGSVIAIALRMPKTGNVNKANSNEGATPSFNLTFNVIATQAAVESDGFGDQYDNTVPFPENLTPTTEPTSSGSKGSGGTSGT